MIREKKRHNIVFKIITVGILCLFSVNTLMSQPSYAKTTSTLATGNIAQPLKDDDVISQFVVHEIRRLREAGTLDDKIVSELRRVLGDSVIGRRVQNISVDQSGIFQVEVEIDDRQQAGRKDVAVFFVSSDNRLIMSGDRYIELARERNVSAQSRINAGQEVGLDEQIANGIHIDTGIVGDETGLDDIPSTAERTLTPDERTRVWNAVRNIADEYENHRSGLGSIINELLRRRVSGTIDIGPRKGEAFSRSLIGFVEGLEGFDGHAGKQGIHINAAFIGASDAVLEDRLEHEILAYLFKLTHEQIEAVQADPETNAHLLQGEIVEVRDRGPEDIRDAAIIASAVTAEDEGQRVARVRSGLRKQRQDLEPKTKAHLLNQLMDLSADGSEILHISFNNTTGEISIVDQVSAKASIFITDSMQLSFSSELYLTDTWLPDLIDEINQDGGLAQIPRETGEKKIVRTLDEPRMLPDEIAAMGGTMGPDALDIVIADANEGKATSAEALVAHVVRVNRDFAEAGQERTAEALGYILRGDDTHPGLQSPEAREEFFTGLLDEVGSPAEARNFLQTLAVASKVNNDHQAQRDEFIRKSAEQHNSKVIIPSELSPEEYRRVLAVLYRQGQTADDIVIADKDMALDMARKNRFATIILTPALEKELGECKARKIVFTNKEHEQDFVYLEGAIALARAINVGDYDSAAAYFQSLTGREADSQSIEEAISQRKRLEVLLVPIEVASPQDINTLRREAFKFLKSA